MSKSNKENNAPMEYLIGNAIHNNLHWLHLAAASPFAYATAELLGRDSGIAVCAGMIAGYIGLKPAGKAAKMQLCRTLIWNSRRTMKKNPDAFPFSFVESIVIDDKQGLEMLLEKTKKEEKDEWGSVHKTQVNNGRAVINGILSPDECIEKEFITKVSRFRLRADETKIKKGGYNGLHHYHPTGGGMDFSINPIDRFKPNDWINLLTFNMPYGPEVIGFNLFNTYIPENRKEKTRLVKADEEQILEYLRAK